MEQNKLKLVKNEIIKELNNRKDLTFNNLSENNMFDKKIGINIKELSNKTIQFENFMGIFLSKNSNNIEIKQFSKIFDNLLIQSEQILQMNINFNECFILQVYSPFCNYLRQLLLLELLELFISSEQNLTQESITLIFETIQKLKNLKALRLQFIKKQQNIVSDFNIQYSLSPLKNLKFLELNFIHLGLQRECIKQLSLDLMQLKILEIFNFTFIQDIELLEEDILHFSNGISTLENLINLQLHWQLQKIDQSCFKKLTDSLNKLNLMEKLSIQISSFENIQSSSFEVVSSFQNLKNLQQFSLLLTEYEQVNSLNGFGQHFYHLGNTLTELYLNFHKKITNGNEYLAEIARGLPQLLNLWKLEIKADSNCRFKEDVLIQLYKELEKCLQLKKLFLNMREQFIFCFIGLIQTLQNIDYYSFGLFNNNYVGFIRNGDNSINQIIIDGQYLLDEDGVRGLQFAYNKFQNLQKICFVGNSNNEKGIDLLSKSLPDRINNVQLTLENNFKDTISLIGFISNLKNVNKFAFGFMQNSINHHHLLVMNEIGKMPNLKILNLNISLKLKKSSKKNLQSYSTNLFPSLESLNLLIIQTQFQYSNSFVQYYSWISHCKNLKEFSLRINDEHINFKHFHLEISKILKNLDHLDSLDMNISNKEHFFINPNCLQLNNNLYSKLQKLVVCFDYLPQQNEFLIIENAFSSLTNLEYIRFRFNSYDRTQEFQKSFNSLLAKMTNLRSIRCRRMNRKEQYYQNIIRKLKHLVFVS